MRAILENHFARTATLLGSLVVLGLVPLPQHAQCRMDQDEPALTTTARDSFAEVGRRVPAFGGMFVDEDAQTLYVYLVPGESGDEAAVDKAINDVFGDDRPLERRLKVLAGRYTYLQLKQWRELLTQDVLPLPGVVGDGIDHRKNGLRVDVETAALVPAIESAMGSLGIPSDAFSVQAPLVEDLSRQDASLAVGAPANECMTKTLQDRCRPLVGGLKIAGMEENGRERSNCTLGFMAIWRNVRGFVTNDHCLINDERPQDTIFYQPSVSDPNRLGIGCYVPKLLNNQSNKDCPAKGSKDTYEPVCRFADATIVKLDASVEGSMGLIAQADARSNKWDGMTKYKIVSLVTEVTQGQAIKMVGQVSGTISGEVDMPKKTVKNEKSNLYQIDQITLKNLDKTPMDGDSGSPVFMLKERGATDVKLVGIFWAIPAGSTDKGDVSPIANIKMTNELGPTLQVCAPGSDPKC